MSKLIVMEQEELQSMIYNTTMAVLIEMRNKKEIKQQMNKKEAAEYMCLSEVTINKYMASGKIPYSKPRGRVIILKVDLDELIKKNKSTATKTVTSKLNYMTL